MASDGLGTDDPALRAARLAAPAPSAAAAEQEQKQKALAQVLRYVTAGGGAGLLGGALYHLGGFLRDPRPAPSSSIGLAPRDFELPVPEAAVKKKRKAGLLGYFGKRADAFEDLAGRIQGLIPSVSVPAPDLSAGGQGHSGHWWYLPASILGGGLAGYGGSSLASSLMRRRRKAEMDAELAKAKEEYRRAALAQFGAPKLAASARDQETDPVGDLYDRLSAANAKSAALEWLPGAYATYALGSGGLMAAMAYQRNKERVAQALKKALARRAAERALVSPPDIEVVPVSEPDGGQALTPPSRRRQEPR